MNKKQRLNQGASSNRNTLVVSNMFLYDRILHYFLVYVIFPKAFKYSQISEIELQILFALKNNIPLNWAYIVKVNMFISRGKTNKTPYAREITRGFLSFTMFIFGEK